jgi:NAD-dependent dihydropyrimidine dehydrogenase PreA subunit
VPPRVYVQIAKNCRSTWRQGSTGPDIAIQKDLEQAQRICRSTGFSSEENTSYEDDRPGFDDMQQLYIDPVECIDCGACVPVCPVSAIFALDDLPEKWKQYAKLNASYVHTARFTPEECAKHSTK